MNISAPPSTKRDWTAIVIGILSTLLVISLTIYAYQMREQIELLQQYGYPGVFLIEIIGNATIFAWTPIPASVITAAVAPLFHPLILMITASTAAALGEMTGYALGQGGASLVENRPWVERATRWMQRYGNIIITLAAAIPNPFFDAVGIAAGILRIPLWKFFVFCLFGKAINRLVLILIASSTLRWLLPI